MTIESKLCRSLDIRFIDARALKMEAMISLGIEGYPNREERVKIETEAVRIFNLKKEDQKMNMRKMNWDLDAMKIPTGSISLSDVFDSATGEGGANRSQASMSEDSFEM